jgi:hypothetical protein
MGEGKEGNLGVKLWQRGGEGGGRGIETESASSAALREKREPLRLGHRH